MWRQLTSSWVTALTLVSFTGCLTASEESVEQKQEAYTMLRTAEGHLLDQEYAKAAKVAIEASESAVNSPDVLQLAAQILYRSGRSAESLLLFDRVVKMVPGEAPYNWQRGIALCSVERWQDGAEQFETHHDVNPDDVENSAWYFLCVAKVDGIKAARKTVIPSRGDGRQPMMSVLQMLKQELKPEDVIAAAVENTSPGQSRQMAKFYADLYVGLYYDSLNDDANAKKYLERSLSHEAGGYMADVARVYLQDRFQAESKRSAKTE